MILHRLCSHYTCTDLYPYALTNALVLLDYRMKPDLQSKASHLHGIRELPVFAQPSNLLTTEKAIGVLLFSSLTEESICSRLPVSLDINAVFVVDLNKLSFPKDVCYDMGAWRWGGSNRRLVSIDEDGFVEFLNTKEKPMSKGCYKVWKCFTRLKSVLT